MSDNATAACAEFPNDNPALHRGAIWRCADPCEAPSVEVPTSALIPSAPKEPRKTPAPRDSTHVDFEDGEFGGDIEIVDEIVFDGGVVEEGPLAAPWPSPRDRPQDPFADWTSRVKDAVSAAGGGPSLVKAFSWLAGEDGDTQHTLADGTVRALAEANLVEQGPAGIARSSRLTRAIDAWKGILRGESEDFSACAGLSLDEWTADVAARLLGAPARAGTLRRDLRARGVAAFGLLDEVG